MNEALVDACLSGIARAQQHRNRVEGCDMRWLLGEDAELTVVRNT